MSKYENEWSIEEVDNVDDDFKCQPCKVTINSTQYYMKEDLAGLTHAILLLVDALKEIKK